MRKILAVVLVLAGVYGGYWAIGSRAVETGLRGWLDGRAAEGWQVSYAEVSTRGFPNRFDTTITGLDFADPQTGLAWSAPFFQLLTLSYKPHHIIAVWSPEQTLATPLERLKVTSAEMRGSIVLEPGTSLTLDRTTLVMKDLGLTSDAGWSATVAEGRFATRQTAAKENHHDVGLQATGVQLAETLRARLDPDGLLPATVETLLVDATLGFDGPWNRFSVGDAQPAITEVDLKDVRARWGEMELHASGTLSVDAQGVPEGRIMVRAENWSQMLELARNAGLVPDRLAPMATNLLRALANASGNATDNAETLETPLTFKGGRVALGPLPLGAAPRLLLK